MSGNDLDAARSQPRDGNEDSGTTNVVYNQIARADILRRWRITTHVIVSCLKLVHASLRINEARNTRMIFLIGKHALVIEEARPSEDFGFPTMGFPAFFSRIAVYPAPETIKAGKCKQNFGIFGLCALLLEFLGKAPVWSSNHNVVDLPVGVNSVVRDEDTTEALYIDLVNGESASDDNDHSGEGMEEKTFNG